jgi:hypothetical protein
MYQIIFIFLLLFSTINAQPILAQTESVQIKNNLAFFSDKFLGLKDGRRYSNKGITELDLRYDLRNSSSQLSLNIHDDGVYNLDGSYLQFISNKIILGIGSFDRNWSFSKNTSLILSQNARPIKSIYLKLDRNFKYGFLPSEVNLSLEAFNGLTKSFANNDESMLLGIRATLSPVEGLDFELVQTSQWGGKDYSSDLSSLAAALFLDTNESSKSNINKMAGFGISYLIPTNRIPLRIYGQAIGEDEAGNLPSCYSYLAGLELKNTKIKYPTILGIEAIDTRINTSADRNCGPNTMYNNNTYDYTNYGKTMGASIDTEGTSLSLFVRSQISQKINIEYATKSVVINDNNWSGHRLSSNQQAGFINSLGISWVKNNISFNGNIYNQTFNLDKANIKSGYGVGFSSSIKF